MQRAIVWRREQVCQLFDSLMGGYLFGTLAPLVDHAMGASTPTPRACAHGGRLWVKWLPLIAIGVVLCLLVVPGGILAQTQVAPPTIDTVTPGDGTLAIAWTAPTGVTGITAYDLRHIRSDAADKADANWIALEDVWSSGSVDLTYTLADLDNGVGYDVQMRAVTISDGQWSSTSTGTPVIPGPVIDTITAGDGALTVSWSAPAVDATTTISAYDVRSIASAATDKADGAWTVVEGFWTAGSLDAVLAGLTNGTGYDVQVRAVADTDGAWSDTATGTPVDHGATTATATVTAVGSSVPGSIAPLDDNDLFKFDLQSTTEVWIYTSGAVDTAGALLDSTETVIASNNDGGLLPRPANFSIRRELAAGTWYIRVDSEEASDSGTYTLHVIAVTASASTAAAAPTVAPGSLTAGGLSAAGVDYFKIVLTSATNLWVIAIGTTDTSGQLLDTNQAVLAENDNSGLAGNESSFSLRASVAAGTYYVKVSGADPQTAGPYILYVHSGNPPGGSAATAAPLVLEAPAPGRIDSSDDEDYFSITLDSATYLRLEAHGQDLRLTPTLFDSQGSQLDIYYLNDPGWPAVDDKGLSLWALERLPAGTYTIRIKADPGQTGAYLLHPSVDADSVARDESCAGFDSSFDDPLYGCQWHLKNTGQYGDGAGFDINVETAWETTLGEGINVLVVDLGLDYLHPDLRGYEYTGDTSMGHYDSTGLGVRNHKGATHGTPVAGIIAARDNDIGGRGVAPRATVYGYTIDVYTLINDGHAHMASHMSDVTAVVNNSWRTPSFYRNLIEESPEAWDTAIEEAVTSGYGGKGVFYVWITNNDHLRDSNANLDERLNHHAGTVVCAVDYNDVRAVYSEFGTNLWVCAPSRDAAETLPGIATTDVGNSYTMNFTGTSAAGPIVSGVAALVRAANPELTWRDVKLILADSARRNDTSNTGWQQGALKYRSTTERYWYNREYGFGVVDAGAAVALALDWALLPRFREHSVVANTELELPDMPSSGDPTAVSSSVTVGPHVGFVEFVEVDVTLTHSNYRDLRFELVSPAAATSLLLPPEDDTIGQAIRSNVKKATYRLGSARHLGEDAAGTWTLRVTDEANGRSGTLHSWELTVYGHGLMPDAPDVTSAATGAAALTINWNAPDDIGASVITAYDVRYIRTDATDKSDSAWTLTDDVWTLGSGGDLEHTISGLTGNVQYDVQVRAVNAEGDGLWSDTVTGTPTTDEAPTIDSVSPGDRSIAVAWTAPTNASLGTVTAYDVRYIRSDASNKADGNWTVVSAIWTSGSLEYTLNPTSKPLVNGVSYDVQVRAVVGTDKHPWSGVRAATPRSTPGAPAIDTVTGAEGALTVAWSGPASDGGDAITSYDLRSIKTNADETDDANWTVQAGVWSAGDLTATVTGLETGTRYDVQVRAVNGVGEGAGPWSATRVGTTRPGAPAVDAVTGVVGGLTVGWSAPAAGGDAAATSYDLRSIKTSADETVESNWAVATGVWSAGDLTATVTGLELGTQYDLQVRAVNAAGAGPWSATRAGTTLFSDDATLTGLTLSGVRLTPGFAGMVTSYAGAVGYTVTGATVAATRSDANAALVILDGNGNTLASADTVAVDLSVGENIIRVRVTAQDGVATMTYTVTVRRTAQDLSLTPPASDPVAPFASTAVYTIQFQGDWTTAATPDGVPGGAHFSRLIGAVHNAGVTFLESGGTASPGVESMAEVGGTSRLRNAVTGAGAGALSVIQGDTNSIGPTALQSLTVTLTTEHPRVTLVTMIAPSPDWFVGVSGLPLLDSGGNWLSSVEVALYPWDAGTENGDAFLLSNPATSPRGVITSIRGTGKFSTERIATLTFTLESVNFAPTGTPFITGVTGAPEVGEALTAHTSGIDDRNGLTSPGYAYQWLRGNSGGQAATISGATSATYRVQPADVGRPLKVRVSFTDDDSTMEALTSDATEAVIVTQVTVSFGAGGYAAEEGGQRATVQVQLDKDPHRTLRVPLRATTGGGAGAPDYAAPSQITFGPGETEKDAHVTAADDGVDDDGESVTLAFGDLPDGVSAGSSSETVVQLIDDDYVPVTLGWEETAFTAEEPTSPGATTEVSLRAVAVTATDKQPESGFALAFTVRTVNGTARQPGDYEELSSTGTFDRDDFFRRTVDGQFRYVAAADFTVTVAHDTVDEPLERFTVRLALAGSGQPHLTLGDSTATVTTTDDVASLADLQTTVFADAGAVEPGGYLTYDWSVRNDGPAAATNTVLTGTLDAGVTFVSAQVSSPATVLCGRSGRRVTCTVGTLEVRDTATGEIVVRVNGGASADMGFTAVAGADQLDRTPADDDASVTTALVAPPLPITDLRAVGERRHIDLTWSPPGDNGSAITGYALERRAGTDDFLPVFPPPPQGTTSYRDEAVAEDTEYTFRLRAVNEDGEGAWSNEPVTRLLAAPPPVSSGGSSGGGGGGGGGFGPAPVAPKFSAGFRTTRGLAQNARPGDAVGDPVAATHPDDLEISYSLSGTDAASFTVNEETGQIRVKDGVDLEVGRTYTVNLTATDSAGFGAIIIVTIEVVEATHHPYDANRNGVIERDEVIEAVKDYFDGSMTREEVIDLIKLYFAGPG